MLHCMLVYFSAFILHRSVTVPDPVKIGRESSMCPKIGHDEKHVRSSIMSRALKKYWVNHVRHSDALYVAFPAPTVYSVLLRNLEQIWDITRVGKGASFSNSL